MSQSYEAGLAKISPADNAKTDNMSVQAIELMKWGLDNKSQSSITTDKSLPQFALTGTEHIAGKDNYAVGKDNHAIGKAEDAVAKHGYVVGKDNHATGKWTHVDGKENHAAGKDNHVIAKDHSKIIHTTGDKFVKHDAKADGESAIKSLDFLDGKDKQLKPADAYSSITKGYKAEDVADGGVKGEKYNRSAIEYESAKAEKELISSVKNKPEPSFLSTLWPF